MEQTTFTGAREVLRRVVKADGRVGSLQQYVGKEVDIVTYLDEEDWN